MNKEAQFFFNKDADAISGYNGFIKVGGKRFNIPAKVVWTQESVNTEPYAEFCAYDSKDELRTAAQKLLRRLVRSGAVAA